MKDTGIVRRIDELGRIVIPKEIRRSLRLRVGTPVEIFITKSGEVILTKYSPVLEIKDFAQSFCDATYEIIEKNVIITDKDSIIACNNSLKKDYLNKSVSGDLEDIMESRKSYISNLSENSTIHQLFVEDVNNYTSQIIVPIIASSDVIGSVITFCKDETCKLTTMEVKVLQTIANFIAKQIE